MKALTFQGKGQVKLVDVPKPSIKDSGDVLVRISWDPRHPVSGRVLELVGPGAGAALWPSPRLVPLLLLYDRQA